jgi:hypothetical protein
MNTKLNKLLILATVVIGALTLFLKSYAEAWTDDDCCYAFVLDERFAIRDTYPPVTDVVRLQTATEAIVSQYNQYFTLNGRSIVHFFTQMFAGPWGQTAFSIFSACLFLAVLFVFVRLTQHESNRTNGIIWFLLGVCLLYLFPEPHYLWYSPALCMNYLLTLFTSIVFFLLYKHVVENDRLSGLQVALIAFYSFVAGWMNEALTIPISGALFFWLLIHRKQWNVRRLGVAIAFWLGTLVLIVGNLGRASGISHAYAALHAIELYAQLKIVWITLIVCLIVRRKNKPAFNEFLKENQFYLLMLGTAVLLSFVANTSSRSLIGVELSSCIILFRLLDRYFLTTQHRHTIVTKVCLAGILLIGVHQAFIIRDFKRVHDETMRMIDEARHTSDGVVKVPDIRFSAWTRPYVVNWMNYPARTWFRTNISRYYLNGKPFFHLEENDYNALRHPEKFFTEEHRMPGNVPVYKGDNYYWMRDSEVPADKRLLCEYYPVRFKDANSFTLGIAFALHPGHYPSKEILALPDTAEITNDKGVLMFKAIPLMHVKSFSYVEQE